jgi:hypothetical protein
MRQTGAGVMRQRQPRSWLQSFASLMRAFVRHWRV